MRPRRAWWTGLVLQSVLLGMGGCAHLTYANAPASGGFPSLPTAPPTASVTTAPTPGATSTPGTIAPQACATQAPAATYVAMGTSVAATSVAPYGPISGYTLATSIQTLPDVAAPIVVRSGDTVQFVNVESGSPPAIAHSAVGFTGATSFPAVPYTFAAGVDRQIGTTIGSQAWSTGALAPQCFSNTFTVTAGTYYFGDAVYYNLTNFRNVLIVNK